MIVDCVTRHVAGAGSALVTRAVNAVDTFEQEPADNGSTEGIRAAQSRRQRAQS